MMMRDQPRRPPLRSLAGRLPRSAPGDVHR